jgi:amidase
VVNAQRRVFESLGCIIEEAEPDFAGADEVFKVLRYWQRQAWAQANAFSSEQRTMLKQSIREELALGEKLSASAVAAAEMKRTEIYHRVRAFMEQYDFFILPTTQVPPFDVSQPYPTEIDGIKMPTYIDWMKSCYYISIVGNPAISVPCGFTPDRLPVGLQIVGRHHDDWGVLQIAHAFEQCVRAFETLPPVLTE